jgi:hypothetical protein
MRTASAVLLAVVLAVAGAALAGLASAQGTTSEQSTESTGLSTTSTVVAVDACPALAGVQEEGAVREAYCRHGYPPMTLSDFRERRAEKKNHVNHIREWRGYYRNVHVRHAAQEIRFWRRDEALAGWRARVERTKAKPVRWHSPANYYSLPSYVRSGFACIHRFEGSWTDYGDPYWGGLQMDKTFMLGYGRDALRRFGYWANTWPARVQVIVAARAYRVRGFHPWPNTAHYCGLI